MTINWGVSSGTRDQSDSANSEQQSSKEPSGDIWSQYFTRLKLAMILYCGYENLDITELSEQPNTETNVQKGVDASKSDGSGKN